MSKQNELKTHFFELEEKNDINWKIYDNKSQIKIYEYITLFTKLNNYDINFINSNKDK